MFKKVRVRPSKGSSVGGMIGGAVFILIGMIIVIPTFGLFGVFWTLMAVVITGVHTYNVFSKKGLSQYQIDIESTDSDQKESESFDVKLRKLKALKDEGFLNDEEYEMKREEILQDKW